MKMSLGKSLTKKDLQRNYTKLGMEVKEEDLNEYFKDHDEMNYDAFKEVVLNSKKWL